MGCKRVFYQKKILQASRTVILKTIYLINSYLSTFVSDYSPIPTKLWNFTSHRGDLVNSAKNQKACVAN